jgi:hypothetical protein
MFAPSPAVPLTRPAHVVGTPAVERGLLAAVAAFIERAGRTPSASTEDERYWTSVARGL